MTVLGRLFVVVAFAVAIAGCGGSGGGVSGEGSGQVVGLPTSVAAVPSRPDHRSLLSTSASPVACTGGRCVAVVSESRFRAGSRTAKLLALSGGHRGWKAITLGLPRNAATGEGVLSSIFSIACPTTGNCVAGGQYRDKSDRVQGLLEQERKGTWMTGIEAPLPANAQPFVGRGYAGDSPARAVSCASAGNCAAVGWYEDTSRREQGVLLSERDHEWTAVQASLPADAAANPKVELDAVSCAAAGDCTAVGTYLDRYHRVQALLVSERNGHWARGLEAMLPRNADLPRVSDPSNTVALGSVACPTVGNCAATGVYPDSTHTMDGLLLAERGGKWTRGVEAELPPGAGRDLGSAVSCPSVGDCAAIENFVDAKSLYQAALLTETGGRWGRGVEVQLPANAATEPINGAEPGGGLASLFCTSPGNCIAVGGYLDRSGAGEGLLVIQSRGVVDRGVEAPLPGSAAKPPERAVGLGSVSCSTPRTCAAIGTLNGQRALLLGPG